jgi:hypothetical protein
VFELKEAVSPPLEGTADSETDPENPLTPDRVTINVALDP